MSQNWTPNDYAKARLRADYEQSDFQPIDVERLIACTEACSGIQNPAAVAAAVEALRELVSALDHTRYSFLISTKAKAALAALNKEPKL